MCQPRGCLPEKGCLRGCLPEGGLPRGVSGHGVSAPGGVHPLFPVNRMTDRQV